MSSPLVVAMVGTDHHPFDRFVAWIDSWAGTHPEVEVFVQHGAAAPPACATGAALMDPTDLAARVARATAVVTHGGLSSIMEARAAGFLPLVVARDPARGEHVDGHQQAFTAHQAERGRIRLFGTEPELHAALDAALAAPVSVRLEPATRKVPAAVEEVADLVDDLLARRPSRRVA